MPYRLWSNRSFLLTLILGNLLLFTGYANLVAQAQLTIQSNPVFSSPTPPEQNLMAPVKPFPGEVIEFDSAQPPQADLPVNSGSGSVIRPSEILLEGNRYYNTWTIKRYLKPVLNKKGSQLSKETLERELNQINRFSKFKVKAIVMRRGEVAGDRIKLNIYEQQPWQLVTTFDNQGRPGTGFYRGSAQLINRSLLGFGDEMSVQYIGATRSHRLSAEYRLPLNIRGGELNFQYAYHAVDYDPELTPPAVRDLSGLDQVWTVTLSQPLDRKRVWTPYVSALWRQVIIKRNGEEITNANPRPVTLGLRYNHLDRLGKTSIDVAPLIVGQHWMGGDSRFYRAKATLYRSFNLPRENQLVFRGAWQATPDQLPLVQQFQIGGEYTVRGYTEGLITAERGQFYSLEHFWPVPGIRKLYPGLQKSVRGVTFVDFGQAWLDKSSPRYVSGISNKWDRTTLMAVGFGVRARMTQYAQGFLDAGWGVFNRNHIELVAQPTIRVHFGIRSNLLPQPFKKQTDTSKAL